MGLGFLGCGKMGQALLGGWLEQGAVDSWRVMVNTKTPRNAERIAAEYEVQAAKDAAQLVAECDRIILAVKPHQVVEACGGVEFRKDQVVISIVAGLSYDQLKAAVAPARLVKMMPNLAVSIGVGVTLMLREGEPSDLNAAEQLFSVVGHVERLDTEAQFHAGTAVAGCGPAYLFIAIEAMADAGVVAGLPRAAALRLAASTMAGSGELAMQGTHPAALKDAVSSPGGVTIEGVRILEQKGFRSALIEAVLGAVAKSKRMEQA